MMYIFRIMSLLLIVFICSTDRIMAQEAKTEVSGKLVTRSGEIEGVIITNSRTGSIALSDNKGYFDLAATVNDTLSLNSLNHILYTYVVSERDLTGAVILFPLEPLPELSYELNQIVISKVIMVFNGKYTKLYTPAERKLRKATTGSLDPIINYLSGRTRMLKKNVAYEKEGYLVVRLLNKIGEDRFIKYYKIPPDYVESFAYYAVTIPEVKDILNSNIIDTRFLERTIGPLVLTFLELLSVA